MLIRFFGMENFGPAIINTNYADNPVKEAVTGRVLLFPAARNAVLKNTGWTDCKTVGKKDNCRLCLP
jgi:hypothetical protein